MHWPTAFSPCYEPFAPPAANALHFAFIGDELLLPSVAAPAPLLPHANQLSALGPPQAAFLFGYLDQHACVLSAWPASLPTPAELQRVNVRQTFGRLPAGHWGLAARAKHMLTWDLATRFCGACGTAATPAQGEPAKVCPACGQRSYPQIAPAIMCLVRRGDQLLLARAPQFRPGMYSALAGFVEAGETVEACTHREVFEETGIRIQNLRWFASQPWPFPLSLMLAFHADYASGDITPQPGEIEDAQWFSLNALPELPDPVSLASRLIADGIAQLRADDRP